MSRFSKPTILLLALGVQQSEPPIEHFQYLQLFYQRSGIHQAIFANRIPALPKFWWIHFWFVYYRNGQQLYTNIYPDHLWSPCGQWFPKNEIQMLSYTEIWNIIRRASKFAGCTKSCGRKWFTCSTTFRCVPDIVRFFVTMWGVVTLLSEIAFEFGVFQFNSTIVPKSIVTEQVRLNGSPILTCLAEVLFI